MKTAPCIIVALLDGKVHNVVDLLPYLEKRIDPAAAVRAFLRSRREIKGKVPLDGSDITLDERIARGCKKIIGKSLHHLTKESLVVIERKDPRDIYTWKIQLAPTASGHFRHAKGKNGASSIWIELRHAVVQGWIGLRTELLLTESDRVESQALS